MVISDNSFGFNVWMASLVFIGNLVEKTIFDSASLAVIVGAFGGSTTCRGDRVGQEVRVVIRSGAPVIGSSQIGTIGGIDTISALIIDIVGIVVVVLRSAISEARCASRAIGMGNMVVGRVAPPPKCPITAVWIGEGDGADHLSVVPSLVPTAAAWVGGPVRVITPAAAVSLCAENLVSIALLKCCGLSIKLSSLGLVVLDEAAGDMAVPVTARKVETKLLTPGESLVTGVVIHIDVKLW